MVKRRPVIDANLLDLEKKPGRLAPGRSALS
jgi:hypothetical protein